MLFTSLFYLLLFKQYVFHKPRAKTQTPNPEGQRLSKNRKDWLVKCRKYKTCFILLYYFHFQTFFGLMYIQRVKQAMQHARCVVMASGSRNAVPSSSRVGGTSLLERLEPLTERASVAFQKNRILSKSAVRTSNFELLCFIHTGLWFIERRW
jgi:hypothetical protein